MSFITTYTGRRVNPLSLEAKDICLMDIAHALSNICRFTGHSKHFYSVAQHSVLVSKFVPQEFALHGLLHDASEAYLHDLPKPLKKEPEFDFYRGAELRAMDEIAEVFLGGCYWSNPSCVHEADAKALVTEARQLMADTETPAWWEGQEDLGVEIQPLSPKEAKAEFIQRYVEIQCAANRPLVMKGAA